MLTDEMAAQITMFMRVVNLGEENPGIVKSNPEFHAAMEEAKAKLAEIMSMLSAEEQDRLLERYKAEAERRRAK